LHIVHDLDHCLGQGTAAVLPPSPRRRISAKENPKKLETVLALKDLLGNWTDNINGGTGDPLLANI
jgi:hypothetical protein